MRKHVCSVTILALFLAALLPGFAVGTEVRAQAGIPALPDDTSATAMDRQFIRRTYEIARQAAAHGNRPYGAVLVHDGKILAEAENTVPEKGDVTRHAEIALVSLAAQKFSREVLSQSTLYTSGEPCLMCCGSIDWLPIARLVYGASSAQVSKVYGRTYRGIPSKELFPRIQSKITVVGPVLEEEGLKIHSDFKSR